MDILSIIGSILACAIVGLIIVSFWTIFWKFCLYKFPFIQAIVELEVSGDQKGQEGPKIPPTVTPEQAQKEREERIARRRTRKAE